MADRILVMYRGRLSGPFEGPDFSAQEIGFATAGVRAEDVEPRS